ncbi:MAG: serine hydrolase, partial [Caldilineaceae bacterium]|nr:serine hydrolase [Caldilineaceae bacterium]
MQLCIPEQANVSALQLSKLDTSMQGAIDKGHLNGIQVLLARRDKPFHFASFGWQDKANDVPMATDTIFRIYSMTKPIVSVATMMLFEEGRLQIADPVGEYLPAF